MSKTYVVDSSNVARKVKKLYMVDAGGIARLIQRAFVVDASNIARQIYQNAVVTLSGGTIEDDDVFGDAFANASLAIRADGTVDELTDTSGTIQRNAGTDWIIPNSAASGAYEVRATLQSGSTPSGAALNTWLALSSDRVWTISQGGSGSNSAQLLIEIRQGSTVLESGVYNIIAQVF